MMIDALARDNAKSLVVHNEGDAAEVLAAAEAKAWKKMGDLCRSFAEEYAESIAYFIQMDELEQELALLQDQAIADLDAEWDGQEVVDD